MIARIFIFVLMLIVLTDGYVHLRYLRHRASTKVILLWWLPGVLMAFYTVFLTLHKDFAPTDGRLLDVYLFLLGLIVAPKLVFVIFSAAGWGVSCLVHRLLHRSGPRRNYGNIVGLVLVLLMWYVLFYGTFVGFDKLTVRHVEYASKDLPAAFDGYRIVHFSDAHVGTYGVDGQSLLRRDIDSIMAQRPDMIVFTGDLQNMRPDEVTPHEALLASLHAPDGVFSVLGNHDYADYIKADEATKAANCRAMIDIQRRIGWTLLLNENRTVCRGADSIVVAGMENDGDGRKFPQKGDIGKTLENVGDSAFVIMLEHDPSSWRRKILPQSTARLTLSGHTHAMQFALWGWSPASLVYSEWGGMFTEGDRAINVSTGLGGFIPFRFGVPGEIVVITLKKK